MPDKRSHRGPGPEDMALFARQHIPTLQEAVRDLSWLRGRGYAETSAVKLVGDRHSLTQRQRTAVVRCACSQQQQSRRAKKALSAEQMRGRSVIVDGYNVLITLEAALSGGLLIEGMDGCIRDLSGIHGTYRKVEETLPAMEVIAAALKRLEVTDVVWLLDSPVSNSGRLKQLMLDFAAQIGAYWDVALAQNPDVILIMSERVVLSSDSAVLDACIRWFNFVPYTLESIPSSKGDIWRIDLSNRK